MNDTFLFAKRVKKNKTDGGFGLTFGRGVLIICSMKYNLHRRAAEADNNGVINPKKFIKTDGNVTSATKGAADISALFTDREHEIIEAIRKNPQITQKQLGEATGIAVGTIKRLLPKMQAQRILKKIGSRRSREWRV